MKSETRVFAISTHEGILLVHKSQGPFAGLWDLPSGEIQPGQLAVDALTKGVLAETGQYVHRSCGTYGRM